MKNRIFGIVIALCGCVLVYNDGYVWLYGVEVTAIVTQRGAESGRRGNKKFPYTVKLEDGLIVDGRNPNFYEVGQKMKVARVPGTNIVNLENAGFTAAMGVVCILAGIAMAAWPRH